MVFSFFPGDFSQARWLTTNAAYLSREDDLLQTRVTKPQRLCEMITIWLFNIAMENHIF